jgi:hypothetical protein
MGYEGCGLLQEALHQDSGGFHCFATTRVPLPAHSMSWRWWCGRVCFALCRAGHRPECGGVSGDGFRQHRGRRLLAQPYTAPLSVKVQSVLHHCLVSLKQATREVVSLVTCAT